MTAFACVALTSAGDALRSRPSFSDHAVVLAGGRWQEIGLSDPLENCPTIRCQHMGHERCFELHGVAFDGIYCALDPVPQYRADSNVTLLQQLLFVFGAAISPAALSLSSSVSGERVLG